MDFKTIQVSNYHGILYAEPEIIVGYVKFLNQYTVFPMWTIFSQYEFLLLELCFFVF
jgi:hypothetical protein